MIKKIFLSFIIIISSANAQYSPDNFLLQDELKNLGKIAAANPASNSISDIITLGDTVWLGTSRGVSVSFDNGENWTNFYNTPVFGTESAASVAYDKYTNTIWASTAHSAEVAGGQSLPEGSGLKYTIDAGNNWTSIPQPVDNPTDTIISYGINLMRAVPVTVRIQNLTYDIAFTKNPNGGSIVWTASFAGGLRKSTDKGITWERVVLPSDNLNSVSPSDTLNFCVSPVPGKICTDGYLNYRVFSIASANDSTLYVGTAGGINKSTDNGVSWVKFNHANQDNPISGNFVVALAYNETNSTIWGATWRAENPAEFYAVSSSSDGGNSWQNFLEGEKAHNFGFKNSQVIAATDNGAFRTSNQGGSWILPTSIVDDKSGLSLATNIFYSAAASGNTIWLGSNEGLARLKENGYYTGEWKIYFASRELTSQSESYAYPNPFSPKDDVLKFKYSTGGTEEKVTIRIFDFGMNLVRTVIQNASRIKSLDDAPDNWNGRDESGSFVPNGVYFYRIDVGSKEPLFGKVIVLQ